MIDFNDEKNAIIMPVYPFTEVEASEYMAFDVLNAASRCKETCEVLLDMLRRKEEKNISEEELELYIREYIIRSANVVQTTVNLLAAMFGGNNEEAQEAINACIVELTKQNIQRGFYGEIEEQEEEQEENNDGADEQ